MFGRVGDAVHTPCGIPQNQVQWLCCPSPYWQQKGGDFVVYIATLIISIVAGIICHYICKWLDRK